jgi:hypothetical protein
MLYEIINININHLLYRKNDSKNNIHIFYIYILTMSEGPITPVRITPLALRTCPPAPRVLRRGRQGRQDRPCNVGVVLDVEFARVDNRNNDG